MRLFSLSDVFPVTTVFPNRRFLLSCFCCPAFLIRQIEELDRVVYIIKFRFKKVRFTSPIHASIVVALRCGQLHAAFAARLPPYPALHPRREDLRSRTQRHASRLSGVCLLIVFQVPIMWGSCELLIGQAQVAFFTENLRSDIHHTKSEELALSPNGFMKSSLSIDKHTINPLTRRHIPPSWMANYAVLLHWHAFHY